MGLMIEDAIERYRHNADERPRNQYEARLKADMVAMLTELHTEIEELPMYYDPLDISDLIQQKINELKEKK